MWQQNLDPLYYSRPLEERVHVATAIALDLNGPDTVRRALAIGPLPPFTQSMTGSSGQSLLNIVAYRLGLALHGPGVKNISDKDKDNVHGMDSKLAFTKVAGVLTSSLQAGGPFSKSWLSMGQNFIPLIPASGRRF